MRSASKAMLMISIWPNRSRATNRRNTLTPLTRRTCVSSTGVNGRRDLHLGGQWNSRPIIRRKRAEKPAYPTHPAGDATAESEVCGLERLHELWELVRGSCHVRVGKDE